MQLDDSVHAVKIGNTTYMAIFEPENADMVSVNVPVLLMIEEQEDKINYSICDPDLRLYKEDLSQFDENGNQVEVSIYSRDWLTNPTGTQTINLSVAQFGISQSFEARGGMTYQFSKEKNVGEV